jgi:uncharacterized membrane protein YjfL (UPF0719 family)
MRYWGSISHWVDILSRYIGAKLTAPGLDRSDTRIDRQRRVIGLILFVIFIGLPAVFLLFCT